MAESEKTEPEPLDYAGATAGHPSREPVFPLAWLLFGIAALLARQFLLALIDAPLVAAFKKSRGSSFDRMAKSWAGLVEAVLGLVLVLLACYAAYRVIRWIGECIDYRSAQQAARQPPEKL